MTESNLNPLNLPVPTDERHKLFTLVPGDTDSTASSHLFMRFLELRDIRYAPIPRSQEQTMDCRFWASSQEVLAEVTQIEEGRRDEDFVRARLVGDIEEPTINEAQRLRRVLRGKLAQIGGGREPGKPTMLVLYSCVVIAYTGHPIVEAVLYGTEVTKRIGHPLGPAKVCITPPYYRNERGEKIGGAFQEDDFRKVSAVCILDNLMSDGAEIRTWHGKPAARVYYNPWADVPLQMRVFGDFADDVNIWSDAADCELTNDASDQVDLWHRGF